MEFVLEAVTRSCAERRALRLSYMRGDGEVRARVVDPIGVDQQRGRLYLEAWDRDRQSRRVFRLDRVTEIEVLDEPAVVPDPDSEVGPLTEAPGQLVRDAKALVDLADELLKASVVAERTRGTQWDEIASALGVGTSSAHGRFSKVVTEFRHAAEPSVEQVQAGDVRTPEELAPAALQDAWHRVRLLVLQREMRGDLRNVAGELTAPRPTSTAREEDSGTEPAENARRDVSAWGGHALVQTLGGPIYAADRDGRLVPISPDGEFARLWELITALPKSSHLALSTLARTGAELREQAGRGPGLHGRQGHGDITAPGADWIAAVERRLARLEAATGIEAESLAA